jgi:predicted enzyme related to lactoylglutathione lyase
VAPELSIPVVPNQCDLRPISVVEVSPVGDFAMPATEGPRPGYHSVTPRIVVTEVAGQVDFLRLVFDATGEVEPGRPAEIRIGDSLIMVSAATERALFPAFLYVYVDDADHAYQRALAAGATTLETPLDTPYGDRRAMVRDPFGNVFQIAHQISVP